ncbi:MAG TPA: hypothetical protein VH592_22135 [Gemmataceae bacterium]
MSTTISLPSPLRVRLAALRGRIRLLRAVGRLALLVIVLGLLAAAAVLADYWLDLPALMRQIILLTWVAVGVVWFVQGVLGPLFRRIDAPALAALIEEKYPDLGERLSSAVELADGSSEGHGSPLLIALLLEETVAQSEPLDFRSAVPARRAAVLAVLGAVTLLLLAAPALIWPQQYSEWAQRFFRSSNDVASAEVPEDIADTENVTPIPPVELADDSPTITITPPAYARSVKEEEAFHGLVDLAPLQYSVMRFDFRFTRPAVAGYLEEWPATSDETPDKPTRHPLTLSADRQAASLAIPAMNESKYRLILEGEHGTRTELPGGTIHVQLDQPPSVRRLTGKTETRSVLPYERIPFEIEAADDIGVAGMELEYRVNDGEIVRQTLEVEGANTPSAVVRHVLDLAGKVQEDDLFSYRFRVSDNFPQQYKGPHVTIHPPDEWLTLRIARRGNTLEQQEILTQRDEINRRLQAIRESLLQEKRDLSRVKEEMRQQASLTPDPLDSMKQLRRENQDNQKALRDLAQSAEEVSALPPVAELARDVADREMHKSQQALDSVSPPASPAEASRQLQSADQQLNAAIKRMDELKKTNDRLAQERLNQAKLEMLAQREKHLAEQAAELATRHPVLDPKAREVAEKLKREQAETTGELERLTQESEPLKRSLQQAQQEEARKLAERARELAKAQRDLAREEAKTKRKSTADRTEPPTAQQKEQQLQLQQDTGELSRQFQRLSQEARSSWPMQSALQRATGDSQQAQQTMQQARDQGQRGEAPAENQSQERAAQLLDQAAQAASEAARSPSQPGNEGKPKSGNSQAGKALAKAGQQMSEAQGQLNRGQAAQAQSAMQQAARALAQAAQQRAASSANAPRQSGMPGQQPGLGRQAGGLPDLSAYGLDQAAFAGKSWGELPGELRTKIVHDMKARYGDDYARMIKSYFEQIADTKKK